MSILNKKQKIFGLIAAARTLTETMPVSRLNSSFPSINNKGDTITFLTDLIKSLIGYAALVKVIVDLLMHAIDDIELKIKKALKNDLKNIVSCGVNPSLPDFVKSTGTGVVIELKKVDFFDLMKVDPKSSSGKLLYNDVTFGLLDSTDFNTFLYGVIQNDGVTQTWKNILNVTFYSLDQNGVYPNNSLVIKATPTYDNKSLTDLNNNYIDSLKLFNTEHVINNIIDAIFGSISIKLKKTRKQLENEAKIDAIVQKMIDTDIGQTIDDSYFEFDNDELSQVEYVADNRQRGVIKLKTSEEIDGSIDQSTLTLFNDDMGRMITIQERKDTLAKHLDLMADEQSKNSNDPKDKVTLKLSFTQNIINTLIKTIVGIILSPKVVLVLLVNFKIIYGESVTFSDAIDFLKKNKQLIRSIIKTITKLIVEILLTVVLKRVVELIAAEESKKAIEKVKNKTAQLLSLVGVPQEAIRIIKGFT